MIILLQINQKLKTQAFISEKEKVLFLRKPHNYHKIAT